MPGREDIDIDGRSSGVLGAVAVALDVDVEVEV